MFTKTQAHYRLTDIVQALIELQDLCAHTAWQNRQTVTVALSAQKKLY